MTRPAPIPHLTLGHLPTPLELMPRLSAELGGPQIWIKRDDATGLAMGGNKVRKLEYLIADAQSQRADIVLTTGATQSNHCRQTAAAAARAGLDCELLIEHRFPQRSVEYQVGGNLFLDRLLGATVIEFEAGTDMVEALAERTEELREAGRHPYAIPMGGSSVVGAMGYRTAAMETLRQAEDLGFEIREIVHATASGGTQAGLVAGLAIRRSPVRVYGISAGAPSDYLGAVVRELAEGVLKRVGVDRSLETEAIVVDDSHVGEAYGVPTQEMGEAVELVAATEGILLDPVYSGKAMAGLLALIRRHRYGPNDQVVFIHTGGTPALFSYREAFG